MCTCVKELCITLYYIILYINWWGLVQKLYFTPKLYPLFWTFVQHTQFYDDFLVCVCVCVCQCGSDWYRRPEQRWSVIIS